MDSGQFDRPLSRILGIEQDSSSEEESDFSFDVFEESEQEKRENLIKTKVFMVEAFLTKHGVFLSDQALVRIQSIVR